MNAFRHRQFGTLSAAAIFGCFGALVFAATAIAQQSPSFSQIVVFGDSLSDTGNTRNRTNDASGGTISYPSGSYNYSDGRFTDSTDTDPAAKLYVGVWHEQLARTFLGLQEAQNSLDGGTNYAFGGATTHDGTSERTVINNPAPFSGGDVTVTIDNMGKQLDDYLNARVVDASALYAVWGGGNDLFDNPSASNVTATAGRVAMLVNRLARAGAKHILVPNVPPLGAVPEYVDDAQKSTTYDTASKNYRDALNASLDGVATSLAVDGFTPTIYRLDVWSNTLGIFADPGAYNFINTRTAAQGRSDINPDRFLFWDTLHPTTAGHHQIAKGAYTALTSPPPIPAKAANLSTRAAVGVGENASILGVIITGDISKKVVIRGLGPSLRSHGLSGVLADPQLTLYDDSGNRVARNDNWKDSQMNEISQSGLAPSNDLESAIVRTLAPGRYTAALRGKNGGTGIGLVEVYDDDDSSAALANLSTRGFVGTGDDVLIGGLIIGEGDSPLIVVRALGPSLASKGVTNPLLDPTLQLHDANGTLIRENNDWQDTQGQAIRATLLQPTDDREAVMVAFLPPGHYTAIVRGQNDTTGVALVEAYRVP